MRTKNVIARPKAVAIQLLFFHLRTKSWIATAFGLAMTFFLAAFPAHAAKKILNVYAWTGEVPEFVVRRFEKDTGIHVNFSTYENNEIMYAKVRASKNSGYDIVMPSSYFVDRMTRQGLLEKLDKSRLSNWKNLNPDFVNPAYDPRSEYSVPNVWGITGIFVNQQYFPSASIRKWSDLWDKKFYDQLLLLDDIREVFSMGLMSLGYPANDRNPDHIREAYLKLRSLMQNVKIFSSGTSISIMIDEDASIGMAWNGDAYKAWHENKNVRFIFPEEGFVVWVDNFCILKNAKHREEAYEFLNYVLRADIARDSAIGSNFPTTNLAAFKLLPPELRDNQTAYPPHEVMRRAQFQTDVGDDTLELYTKYWEELKMSG